MEKMMSTVSLTRCFFSHLLTTTFVWSRVGDFRTPIKMKMTQSTYSNRNRWIYIGLIAVVALFTLSPAELAAQSNEEKDKTKAELIHEIEEWLDEAPHSFEKKTKDKIESEMHKTAIRLKTRQAELEAQIALLERLEGFIPEEKKVVAKMKNTVLPKEGKKVHTLRTGLQK